MSFFSSICGCIQEREAMFLGDKGSKAVGDKKHGPSQTGQNTVEEYHRDLAREVLKEAY